MRSELIKVKNPYTKAFNRETYFTPVKFKLGTEDISIKMKVDTGATYTVIGLGNEVVEDFKDVILKSDMLGAARDASDRDLHLYGYIVDNFKLTDDIVLDKIKLFFSEDIKNKALLGMDILSLFDFQYLKEKRQNYGTFWINNYEEALREIKTRQLNKDIDYIDPILIASIDDQSQTKEKKNP